MIQLVTTDTGEHLPITLRPSDLHVYEDASSLPEQMCCIDVHISCPRRLIKTLVAEFEHQFPDGTVSVYDYGYSQRFKQGYLILSWDKRIPLSFKRQLDADPRLEGYTVSVLPEDDADEVPASITRKAGMHDGQ